MCVCVCDRVCVTATEGRRKCFDLETWHAESLATEH